MAKTKYRIGGEVAGALAFLRGDDLNMNLMRRKRNSGQCAVWNEITADGMTDHEMLDLAVDEYERGWVRGWWGAHADAHDAPAAR